jgi:hypothetical protein
MGQGRTPPEEGNLETASRQHDEPEIVFQAWALHTITVGQVQDYMSWRRLCPVCSGEGCEACDQTGQGVKEITLRHDLHALSPLFKLPPVVGDSPN